MSDPANNNRKACRGRNEDYHRIDSQKISGRRVNRTGFISSSSFDERRNSRGVGICRASIKKQMSITHYLINLCMGVD
jgi:hypothetical protein